MTFKDRLDAGQKLAQVLQKYKNAPNTIILALPRGGVVIGFKVAEALNLPLDIVVPRKIGAPGNPEFAIGAITETGEGIFDEQTIAAYGINQSYLDNEIAKEKIEAERRRKLYRGTRPPLDLKNKNVVIVDDGLATGLTMRAAIKTVKLYGAAKIIVAIPVTPPDTAKLIKKEVDELIYLDAPAFFGAVGAFYEEFGQTMDEEVVSLLQQSEKFGKE
ncbi:phosphoribosyltransferase [Candidatus Falkowbacteria bacterium]|nr:phosphoribosyltransferase [Candidatus Falkowbacteria bacterium]